MDILRPLTASILDRHAWAEDVLAAASENEITFPGIREFKAKLRERKLDTDDSCWLAEQMNKALADAGLWFHYKLGIVMGD